MIGDSQFLFITQKGLFDLQVCENISTLIKGGSMKWLLLVMALSFGINSYAYQCEDFKSNKSKMKALEFISKKVYGYKNSNQFCEQENYLDLELNFMPNYFKTHEEDDDHYKLMVHYAYSSCTIIYNSTKRKISYKKCYSTW